MARFAAWSVSGVLGEGLRKGFKVRKEETQRRDRKYLDIEMTLTVEGEKEDIESRQSGPCSARHSSRGG